VVKGVELGPGTSLPSLRAFMDDVAIVAPKAEEVEEVLCRLEHLIKQCKMRFKPVKRRSFSMRKRKVTPRSYMIGGETIPTVLQQPVKSLGRMYSIPLTDRYQGKQVLRLVCDGLARIDKCGLPGKYKAWCYQFGLLPRVLWPLHVYDIPLSPVEQMEQKVSVKLRKWL